MENDVMSGFKFLGYVVDKIDFKLNSDYDKKEARLDFNLECNIKTDKELKKGSVNLVLKFLKNSENIGTFFDLEISLTGFFESLDMEEEGFKKMLNLNGVALLFPFLRSAIADITKTANIPPLLLPVINVHKMLENFQQAKKEE